jgi:hypothetical protein
MRVGSHLGARFKGQHDRECLSFTLASATPLSAINVNRAARQIVNACRRGDPQLTITVQAKAAVLVNALMPGVVARALALTNRLLPGPAGPAGDTPVPGWTTRAAWSHPVITALLDRAAERNNELSSLRV